MGKCTVTLKHAGIYKKEDASGETRFTVDGEVLRMSSIEDVSLRTLSVGEDLLGVN
jgi:hypothetical protein